MKDKQNQKQRKIKEIISFIDEHKTDCLWFFDKNALPDNFNELKLFLGKIKVNGNFNTYQTAAGYEKWLSQNFNEKSLNSLLDTVLKTEKVM